MTEATNIQTRILNKATKDYGFSQFINKLEVDVFEGNKYDLPLDPNQRNQFKKQLEKQ